MRFTLALAALLYGGTLWAQSPWLFPYATRNEAMAQQRFDNQLRMRQQLEWEKRTPESNYVLDFTEQVARIRALRAQQNYYESQSQPMRSQDEPAIWRKYFDLR